MTNPQNEQMPDNPGAPEATDPEYVSPDQAETLADEAAESEALATDEDPLLAADAELEDAAIRMGQEINMKSPTAQRMLKFAFNLTDDGLMGQQVFAGEATRLAYMTDEAVEGKESFLEKREPNWDSFPYYY